MRESVRTSILTLAAVVVTGLAMLTSCTKDEGDLLIGTWDLTKKQNLVPDFGVLNPEPATSTKDVNPTSITFNADGTWTGTYTYKTGKTETVTETGKWSFMDGKLCLEAKGDKTGEFSIDSLTAKELILSYAYRFIYEGVLRYDGTPLQYDGTFVMTFAKR